MDNSQSSEIFSDTPVNFRDVSAFDLQSYDDLVLKIKSNVEHLSAKNSKFSNHFSTLLHDCSNCVFQGLDIVVYLLEDSKTPIDKLFFYLEETICILQIISNSIRNMIQSMAVTFSSMRTFSTTTGNIILSVFSHCKDSECIYESHIKTVKKQLKDLFKNCHELQLTYLMALEKHFIFDLTETEQQDILLETLDINLKIGELVQALDVKTMAEQWKAYTMICEKYSSFLFDKNIFNKTTKLLVDIIQNHIKTSFELSRDYVRLMAEAGIWLPELIFIYLYPFASKQMVSENDKVVIRSFKVASFSLKIVLRICKIFKCPNNNYEHIVELLQQILLYSSSHHEVTKMSSKIITNTNTHLLIPSEAIITHLVTEENFIEYITSIDIRNIKDLRLLEYILLLLSVMKASLTHKDMQDVNLKTINLVISILPYCHTYLNMGLTYKNIDKNHGLFEHLLIHALAVSTSLDSKHYANLEISLYKAILSTDYLSALFCSNLWVLLCRSTNSQLHLNTLLSLIGTYQRLETSTSFLFSPQYIHLNFTIENLFKTLEYPEKLNIFKQFSVYQDKNDSIWCILKIKNLPENLQMSAKKVVTQKVISLLELLCKKQYNDHLQDMIKIIKLASTCEFLESDSKIQSLLVQAWCKVCPKANKIKLQRDLDVHSVLYFRYLEALSALTESYYEKIEDNSVYIRILHIISNTLQLGNIEIIRLLFKIFCKFIVLQEANSLNKIVTETLKYLLEKDDIESYIYSVIISNEEFNNYFTQMLLKDNNLQEVSNFTEYKSIFVSKDWQQRIQSAADGRYTHKCVQSTENVRELLETAAFDRNFESVDIDSSLELENHSHSVNKKAKLDTNIENILERLESNMLQLVQVKENILNEECKTRIKNMCDKLQKLL